MSETVGIVVPCYRVAPFIVATVRSLVDQQFSRWKANLIDDGSPDDIRQPISDILANDARLGYSRIPNGGVAAARNHGFRLLSVECKYIMFLDGDDALKPEALTIMVEELEKYPEAGMVHCEPEFVDENGNPIPDREWLPRWGFGPRRLGTEDRVTPFESVYTLAGIIPSLTLYRRSVFEKTPGYDEAFGHNFEDTDVNLQMAIQAPVRYLPEKLVCYRIRNGQASANPEIMHCQEQKLYEKWRDIEGLTPEQKEMVVRAERFRRGPLEALRGFSTARRHFRRGELMLAFRFWQGAVRRWMVSR